MHILNSVATKCLKLLSIVEACVTNILRLLRAIVHIMILLRAKCCSYSEDCQYS